MHAAVLRYRVMAYITGVLIIIVCFVGIPMQLAAHNDFIVNDIGTLHGVLYIVYVVVAWMLAQRLRLAAGPTVLMLLAGTVPVMTFVVERWVTRKYIDPAVREAQASEPAAESARPPAR